MAFVCVFLYGLRKLHSLRASVKMNYNLWVLLHQVKLPTCKYSHLMSPLTQPSRPPKGARKEGLGSIGWSLSELVLHIFFHSLFLLSTACYFSILWSSLYPSPVCKSSSLSLQRASQSKSSYAPSLPISEFTNWNIKLNNKTHLFM